MTFATTSVVSISRIRYMLQWLDVKSVIYLFLILPMGIFGIYTHGPKISSFFRPLWQSPPKPFIDMPHYYSENMTMEKLCSLHGWKVREYPRQVYDAVIFNNEIDMLTIRWKELYPYITQFVLLESNSTFTGLPKPYFFAMNKDQFKFIQPRLTYATTGGGFHKGKNPFIEEAHERVALDKLLGIAGIEDDDLLIMSDVDEIPSAHTINLLRWCDDIPPVLHLELKNYLYSFEFRLEHKSWRASVHRYQKEKTKYVHYRQTDYLLADSGWHCSFCFRLISDFVFKMKAYSHTDRIRYSHFLDHDRIQDIICRGADLFDMLPEEYTFRDIIGNMGPIPHSYSAVNLPSLLYDRADKYKYLLPELLAFKKMHEYPLVDGFGEITEGSAEMIKFVANEPSVGLFYIQQHTKNATTNLVDYKKDIMEKSHEIALHEEDSEESITIIKSMKDCGFPIADEMTRDIDSSISIMTSKQPKRGLITSTSWSYAMGGRNSSYKQDDGTSSDGASGYFSNVFRSAKQKVSLPVDGRTPGQEMISLTENYEEFKAYREAKLEEWLEGMENEDLPGPKSQS